MVKRLTEAQLETIDYWRMYYNEHGNWPTLRCAAKDLGIGVNAVGDRLRYTAKKGYFRQRFRDGRWVLVLRKDRIT